MVVGCGRTLPLLALMAIVRSSSGGGLAPVVIVPGTGGSILEAKLNKPVPPNHPSPITLPRYYGCHPNRLPDAHTHTSARRLIARRHARHRHANITQCAVHQALLLLKVF